MFNYVKFNRLQFNHFVTRDPSSESFVPHHHTDYEILYIIKGSGSFLIESDSYKFTDHTVFVIPPGKFHVLEIPPQHDYERCFMHFPAELLPPSINAPVCLCKPADENTQSLFLKFDRYADIYPKDALYSLLISFLSELLITLAYDKTADTLTRDNVPTVVKNAVSYIEQHLEQPLTLSDIASGVFASETHLSHSFSQTMRISVMRYVRLKKMFLARNFLRSGYPPAKVAQLVGYNDYPTFYKNYVSTIGEMPSKESKSR